MVAFAEEVARDLSNKAHVFAQLQETASDVVATRNVLTAGRARARNHSTEAGGLLFIRWANSQANRPLFDYDASHPSPSVRALGVQQTAQLWRATGGLEVTLPFVAP